MDDATLLLETLRDLLEAQVKIAYVIAKNGKPEPAVAVLCSALRRLEQRLGPKPDRRKAEPAQPEPEPKPEQPEPVRLQTPTVDGNALLEQARREQEATRHQRTKHIPGVGPDF